jgi:hypothetical protein
MVRIFSFGERWNVPFNSAVASLNGTFHLSPHENILTIALINIHYLYTVDCHGFSLFLGLPKQCEQNYIVLLNKKIGTLGVHVSARKPPCLFYCLFAGIQP